MSSSSHPSAMLVLIAVLTTTSAADDVTVRVDEDLSAGRPVADVRSLLSLDEQASVSLKGAGDSWFRLDDAGWLVTADNARLDFESRPVPQLTLEVVTRRDDDPLRERFVVMAESAGVDVSQIESFRLVRRRVTLRIEVVDRPEPPRIVARQFTPGSNDESSRQRHWGRIVATDPDAGETLRYELVGAPTGVQIDKRTGELSASKDFVPTPQRSLAVTVQVTDSAGLTDRRTFDVWQLSPAPTTPVRDVQQVDQQIAASDVEAATAVLPPTLPSIKRSSRLHPSIAPAPQPEELTGPSSAEPSASAAPPLAVSPEEAAVLVDATSSLPVTAPPYPTGATTPNAPIAHKPATADVPNRTLMQTLGWFVWSFVAAGALIIINARIRENSENAELDLPPGRLSPESSTTGSHPSPTGLDRSNATSPTVRHAQRSTPAEIEEVLARLSESLGEGDSVVNEPSPVEVDQPGGGSATHAVDELMTRVLSTAGLLMEGEQTGDLLSGATVAARPTPSNPPQMIGEEFGMTVARSSATSAASATENAGHPLRRRTDDLDKTERRRIEEFRQISRRSSQAEITRRHRERMREQWMSVGVTALASLITGTVCVVSGCFAEISLPIGLVLISVSLTLLMRRSLYPPTPRRRATDFLDDDATKSRE